jgi:hypothetical protein
MRATSEGLPQQRACALPSNQQASTTLRPLYQQYPKHTESHNPKVARPSLQSSTRHRTGSTLRGGRRWAAAMETPRAASNKQEREQRSSTVRGHVPRHSPAPRSAGHRAPHRTMTRSNHSLTIRDEGTTGIGLHPRQTNSRQGNGAHAGASKV